MPIVSIEIMKTLGEREKQRTTKNSKEKQRKTESFTSFRSVFQQKPALFVLQINWLVSYDKSPFTERYPQADHNFFSEIPFNKNLNYIGTSQFIYIANQLTGFCKVQISEHISQSVHKYISVKTMP